MRLLFLGAIASLGLAYGFAAYHTYGEERAARISGRPVDGSRSRHPEANLRTLREAFEQNNYSDALVPNLERALEEAPAFYQAPFLMAALLSNRLDEPARIRTSFEAALKRYPQNGRLHLAFAEWLLVARDPAPYRLFREAGGPERRQEALDHVSKATRLEPELTRPALQVLVRYRVPIEEWWVYLPRDETTELIVLDALERASSSFEVRASILRELLDGAETLQLQERITLYARRWRASEIAAEAAERWRQTALAADAGDDIVAATSSYASVLLEAGESERAYALLRETLDTLEARALPADLSVRLLSNVGTSFLNRGSRAMAQALLTEAVTLSPYHVPSRLGLARIFQDGGELEAARRELDEVLRIDPSNETALAMMGDVLGRLER